MVREEVVTPLRTFIAIELPEPVKEALHGLNGRLRDSGARATWVKPENMHLTLRFLGEVEAERVEKLAAILTDACQGKPPFTLAVRGIGAFPNPRKPEVIWAGAEPLEGPLAEVRIAAENAARAIGLPPDDKAFRAHLTLARLRDRRAAKALEVGGWTVGSRLREYLERERDFAAGEFTVRSVSLFSSELTPHGPVYRRLEEFPF